MARKRQSLRESIRVGTDYSLLVAAAMLVILGIAVSRLVVPNYHEQQAIEARRDALQHEVADLKRLNKDLRDEIDSLEDPYYVAYLLVSAYGWRYPAFQLPPDEG
jgi:cell division protein FtsB